MCKLRPVLKEKIILWIIDNANDKNFALSLENALPQRYSILYKDIEFLIVFETVAGFIECTGCIS